LRRTRNWTSRSGVNNGDKQTFIHRRMDALERIELQCVIAHIGGDAHGADQLPVLPALVRAFPSLPLDPASSAVLQTHSSRLSQFMYRQCDAPFRVSEAEPILTETVD
jgi:hypothetical protein